MPSKRWPIDRFQKLCVNLLEANEQIIIGVFGGTEDKESGDMLRKVNNERIVNFAGRTSVIESAALKTGTFFVSIVA